MLKDFICLFIIGLFINVLNGCNGYSKEEFKQEIQAKYDRYRIRENIKGDICFYIGQVKFPFTQEAIDKNETDWAKSVKRQLTRTLPLFTEIGLLSRKRVEEQPGLYYYELTELGKEYHHFYSKYNPLTNNIINDSAFCYGLIKVEKVSKIKVENNNNMPYPHKHEVYVDYDYHVEDVPDWVVTYQEKLATRYDTSIDLEDQKYEEIMLFQSKPDGYLSVSTPIGGYREFSPHRLKGED